jgi:2-polyprenyl-3-methyl-5-hydroxy-6-metoxy-1,4-benzoquinol methylase
MEATSRDLRNRSFGQHHRTTAVDRCGIWLSSRKINRFVGNFSGKRVADVGCGYHATFAQSILDKVSMLTVVDVSLSDALKGSRKVRVIEGHLPEALEEIEEASLDVVICNSVLEHLWEPEVTLDHFFRILTGGGTALINVPSWRGKRFLEFSAFRLGLSPADEMQDHKTYYDPRDLWPLIVRAGFRPRDIRCFTHKFGLNTFAVCRKASGSSDQ